MAAPGRAAKRLALGLGVLASSLWMACGTETTPPARQDMSSQAKNVVAPAFSADSAYAYVERQVAFGPRVPNTDGHAQCADWLAQELERHGAEVTVQEGRARAFDGTILDMKNIIGTFHPESRDRILLFAHWDTRPFADKDTARTREPIDGANDGASGVGVLLEVARQLGLEAADVGVDIVFFDAEDYGKPEWLPATENGYKDWCLGSQYWAQNPHRIGYRARFGILLDMVGAKDAVFHQEGTSLRFAPHVVRKVWKRAADLGFGDRFDPAPTPPTIDDNYFVSDLAGIPSANIVDYRIQVRPMGYGPFHHTHADNMSVIDKETLGVVGTTVLSVVRNP